MQETAEEKDTPLSAFASHFAGGDEALAVQISRSGIVVDGKPVLELRNGIVDPSQKQGGSSATQTKKSPARVNFSG